MAELLVPQRHVGALLRVREGCSGKVISGGHSHHCATATKPEIFHPQNASPVPSRTPPFRDILSTRLPLSSLAWNRNQHTSLFATVHLGTSGIHFNDVRCIPRSRCVKKLLSQLGGNSTGREKQSHYTDKIQFWWRLLNSEGRNSSLLEDSTKIDSRKKKQKTADWWRYPYLPSPIFLKISEL